MSVLKTYKARRNHYGDAWAVDAIDHPASARPYPHNCVTVVSTFTEAIQVESGLNAAFSDGMEYGKDQQKADDTLSKMHCGYSNYETFVIAEWINNDAHQLRFIRALANLHRNFRGSDEWLGSFAEGLKNYSTMCAANWIKTKKDCFVGSLVSAALGSVDWLELAKEYSSEEN